MNIAASDPELGKSIKAAGLDTNYLEQGSGFPVMLLHGSGPGVTGYANWRFTIPVLAEHFRVIAPDAAGFGYTERKEGQVYDMDFWVRHTVGLMDALGIEKAHFVGNSFGGALTIAIAARHPERVDRIVLMGAGGLEFDVTEGLEAVWGYQPSPDYMRMMMQEFFAYDKSLIREDLVKSRYEASIRPGYHESFSSMFAAPRQRHLKMMATPEDMVAALPNRALIIHGREDRVVPLEVSFRFHQLLKHSELHVFGECGHWTQIEKKDRFNKLITDFFLV
ncbi:alpha/beta hydrolase [Aquibium sp. LZ166]|uniref:Alpha/beta hydrolase n=1 Tax=Aquibium pacificus TaxID=3153579 RepID=A0ABV3SHA8_9HYPH